MKKQNFELFKYIFWMFVLPIMVAFVLTAINTFVGIIALSCCFVWFLLLYWLYTDYSKKDNPHDPDDPSLT